MKKIFLFLIVVIITTNCFAQATIGTAFHFNFYNYLNYNPPMGAVAPIGPDYGCLHYTTRPVWFYFTVCGADSGAVYAEIALNGGSLGGVELIIWGPFDDTVNIANRLTAANIDTCYGGVSMFIPLPQHLQYPKFYYGMFAVDTSGSFGSMDRMWTGGWWFDERCGICNNRVANYKQDICLVTIDSATQKNAVIWDKQNNAQIASFNIYREGIVANQFDSIANIPVTADGIYIDSAVNPNQRSYRYRMSAVDSCGSTAIFYDTLNPNHHFDSALVHTTIHLQGSLGLNNEVNLVWNPYVGFPYNTFYIYRGTSPASYQILDSVAATTLSYTDYNAQPGLNYYKVTVRKSSYCSPDGGVTVYSSSRSNNPYAVITGIDELFNSPLLNVSPNPANNIFNISTEKNINNGMVNVFNLIGEKIYSEPFSGTRKIINLKLSPGVYLFQVTEEDKIWMRKIINQ